MRFIMKSRVHPSAVGRPTRAQAEARQAGEIIEDDGETFGKIVSFLENLKVI